MIQSVKKNQALDLKGAKTKKAVKDPAPSETDQTQADNIESFFVKRKEGL